MSKNKNLLQSVLDELTDGYEQLREVWEADSTDDFVDKNGIVDCTNSILMLLRTLHSTDLGDDAETVLHKMQDIKNDMKILSWSAVYIHLEQFIDELEQNQK